MGAGFRYPVSMENRRVADLLEAIADTLELRGEDHFRIRAYREAARNIANDPMDVAERWHTGMLEDIPGVGVSISQKIADFLRTGRSAYLEEISQGMPRSVAQLLVVPGLGPKRARLLYESLGIQNLEELAEAARQHRIQTIPGMGAKTEASILKELERYRQRERRLLLGEAWPLADEIAELLNDARVIEQAVPAGSIRRRRETVGDIDILASSREQMAAMDVFIRLPVVQEILAYGPTKSSVLTHENLQVDLRVVAPEEFGAALQHFTGSKAHNIALRDRAIALGYKLNEYGLFRQDNQRRVAGRTEEEIYEALGLIWIPPELRENEGELEAAGRHRLPDLIEEKDIRGDLHTHTDWSDGHNTLEEMVEAAIRRGYEYLAITDHSQSLGIAQGLNRERFLKQHRLIQQLNQRYQPFLILHGAEVDILQDGSLDYPDELLSLLDWVGVSIHSGMKQPEERMTQRILRALQGRVNVLNHPTGRLLSGRPPYELDLERVMEQARARGVALEVNGTPDRLDLNGSQVRRAIAKGCRLTLDTDAHSVNSLDYMRYAVVTARRGWVQKRDVLNALRREDLLAYLKGHLKAA